MSTLFPKIILASKSPRRQELLAQMGLEFSVVLKDVDESFPAELKPLEIAVYIAEKKAKAFDESLNPNELVLTADTIVCIEDKVLGKPKHDEEAFEMLNLLSGKRHEVITGVAFLKNSRLHSFYETTYVYFKKLSLKEISYYIETCKPYDKAGSYGIQEWIGLVGIDKIIGSYTNVVGLPTQRVYQELEKFI